MIDFCKSGLVIATIVVLGFLPAIPAQAGTIHSARIKNLGVYGADTSYPYLVLLLDETGGSCEWPQGMTVRTDTDKGRAILSVATSAFLAGKPVTVRGTGNCVPSSTSGWSYPYTLEEIEHLEMTN